MNHCVYSVPRAQPKDFFFGATAPYPLFLCPLLPCVSLQLHKALPHVVIYDLYLDPFPCLT